MAEVVVLVTHDVKDFSIWKKMYDTDGHNRSKVGLKELFVGRDRQRPNRVCLGFLAASEEKAQAFMDSPAVKETMQKAGVVSPPEIQIINPAR